MRRPGQGGFNQRGSALLIVFVFAAMVAIMLYAEMPVAVFEAKRQKEQLLIDRGNEYAHAVKLFVRKFGMYPASIDQLENTNRMRFLRSRYKDPFTGKDDWRPLHAGPGGMLIDSKVKPLNAANAPGSTPGTAPGSSSSFGSGFSSSSTSASSDFGQPDFGSSSQGAAAGAVVVPSVPQRPPAISATGAPSTAGTAGGEVAAAPVEGDQSPTTPLLTPGGAEQAATIPASETSAQPGSTAPGQGVGTGAQPGQNGQAGQAAPGQNPLNNRPQQILLAGSTSGTTGSTLGQINTGGLAGVASKAQGHSIKTVNDQTDYSLWEFYYDPTKDVTRGLSGGPGAAQPGLGGNNGVNTGVQPQNPSNQTTSATNTTTTTGGPAFPANPSNPPQ